MILRIIRSKRISFRTDELPGPQAIHNEKFFKVSKNAFVSHYDLEKRKYVKDAFHTAPTDRNCEETIFQSIKELICEDVFLLIQH